MKNRLLYPLLLFVCLVNTQLSGQNRCGFNQIYEQLSNSPEFIQSQNQLNLAYKSANHSKTETIFIVPTVIHVIYKNSTENISFAQIQSQLDVLNEDYRKLNIDTTNVEQGFSIADVGIEFCLAQRDPFGNETTGITRTSTTLDDVCELTSTQYYQLAPIWDPDKYLNIWVCDINDVVAGYAYPPNQVARNKDGVVIQFENFGNTGVVKAPYNLGRTTTHEIGHWFNLFHPWGMGNNASCSSDDGVGDTPNQGTIYSGCPSIPKKSCGSNDMLSNFMGYVDDKCMGNFTEGQKDRARTSIIMARPSLLLSKGCLPVGLEKQFLNDQVSFSPNPANQIVQFQVKSTIYAPFKVSLMNINGKLLKIKTKKGVGGFEFYLGDVPNGLYFIKLQINDEVAIKKIVVAH